MAGMLYGQLVMPRPGPTSFSLFICPCVSCAAISGNVMGVTGGHVRNAEASYDFKMADFKKNRSRTNSRSDV